MKVGLIDIDYKNFPNIALMKLSAYHKRNGDSVEFYSAWGDRYDIVYISKVFSFSPDYTLALNADKVIRGGSGYAIRRANGKEFYNKEQDQPLPYEIEHIYPDYSLYPNIDDTAFGFLTRGCPRQCPFCIVSKKESTASVKVADLSEFWRGQKNIVLCDPNILASKDWKPLLESLIESDAVVDFNQGLDIRLMNEEKALLLRRIKKNEIHFAWDRYEDGEIILPKLRLYAEITGRSLRHKAIVYTLVNYDTTFEQDLDRIYTLRDMGFWAYVMIYDKENCDEKYKRLQRWVNMRSIFSKVKRFEFYK